MNCIYRLDRYTNIRRHPFDDIHPDILVKYFNQEYNHKDGVKLLLSTCTLDRMINYSMIQGVLREVGANGVNIRTMDDLNTQVINNYDAFWDAVQDKQENSLLYCRSILATYPRMLSAMYGLPVALVSQDDGILGLKNIGYTEKLSSSYYAYYSDGLIQDKRFYKNVRKRCADDVESFKHLSSSDIEIG